MKIYFNIITAACIAFLIAFSFAGCGRSDDSQGGIEIHDIAGSWTLTSFRVGDREYDMKEYFDKYGVNSRDYEMKFTFKEDGTVTGKIFKTKIDGTYELEGSAVKIKYGARSKKLAGREGKYTYDKKAGELTAENIDRTATIVMTHMKDR